MSSQKAEAEVEARLSQGVRLAVARVVDAPEQGVHGLFRRDALQPAQHLAQYHVLGTGDVDGGVDPAWGSFEHVILHVHDVALVVRHIRLGSPAYVVPEQATIAFDYAPSRQPGRV